MAKPLAIDLFCGLGGWADGLLAEGYDVVGFDIERHQYGADKYPAQLVVQDVLTLDGRQFKGANVIVASPPCQEYSYMAMPWSRAKEKAAYIRERQTEWARLTALFWACFRIAREANQANAICRECRGRRGGFAPVHHFQEESSPWETCSSCNGSGKSNRPPIPLVVENVKGAQPWVGSAAAHYGSFYLWGDVASVGGAIASPQPKFGETLRARRGGKNSGNGSWFAISHGVDNGQTYGDNPVRGEGIDGRKVPGMNGWSGFGEPGYKPQGFNVTAAQRWREEQTNGTKCTGQKHGEEYAMTRGPVGDGVKQHGSGDAWFDKALD